MSSARYIALAFLCVVLLCLAVFGVSNMAYGQGLRDGRRFADQIRTAKIIAIEANIQNGQQQKAVDLCREDIMAQPKDTNAEWAFTRWICTGQFANEEVNSEAARSIIRDYQMKQVTKLRTGTDRSESGR